MPQACMYCESPIFEAVSVWFCSDMCYLKFVIRKAIAEDDARRHGREVKMTAKWINLADLAAAGKPDRRDYHGDGVDRKRPKLPRVGRADRDDRQPDRADDRDEKDQPDRDDDHEDVDRA